MPQALAIILLNLELELSILMPAVPHGIRRSRDTYLPQMLHWQNLSRLNFSASV